MTMPRESWGVGASSVFGGVFFEKLTFWISTACVAVIRKGQLHVANLGDSGLMLIRPTAKGHDRLVFRNREQQHRFNMPYQLGTESRDLPEHAEQNQLVLSKVRGGERGLRNISH